MKIEGQKTFSAGSEVIWSLLFDPLTLENIIPGCRSFIPAGSDEYRLAVDVRIGQPLEHFEGGLRFERIVPRRSFSFVAEGGNPDGAVSCRGDVVLEDLGPDLAALSYVIDVETSGRPATITARMMQTTTRSFIRRSFEALERQVSARTRVYTTSAPMNVDIPPYSSVHPDYSIVRRRLLIVLTAILIVLLLRQRAGGRRVRQDDRQATGAPVDITTRGTL